MAIAFSQTGSITRSPAVSAAAELSSDRALMVRIAAGDQLAMRTLFARHRTSLYRWLARITGDGALAEDLLSEVFLDVWRQAGRFKAHCAVSTWLFAVGRYKALSAMRRRRDATLDTTLAQSLPDPVDDPEVTLEKKSTSELLARCLAKLSREHREVLDLVYYHGKSVREVSEIVGAGEATVKTRMFYARKRLTQLVEQA
jgi:RNA polymerase sigma-70 factor (ECF subfamily)